MACWRLCIVINCVVAVCFGQFGSSGNGRVIFKYARNCARQPPNGLNFTVSTTHLNRTMQAVSIQGYSPYPYDKNMGLKINVAKHGNGGWKSNFLQLKSGDFCRSLEKSGVKQLEKFFQQYSKESNFPPSCPWPKGHHKIHEYPFSGNDIPVPSALIPIGEFRIEFTLMMGTRKLFCAWMFIETVEINRPTPNRQMSRWI